MDYALYLIVFLGSMLGSFLGAWFSVSMAEKYYQRKQENKLYGTVFSGDPTAGGTDPEPIGDKLISPQEYSDMMEEYRGADDQDCDSPEEVPVAPNQVQVKNPRGLGWPPPPPKGDEERVVPGWSDNNAAGIFNKDEDIKPLPGELGRRR